MTTYKKWTLITLSITVIALSAIASVNYVVDPYGIYHYSGKSFNYQKSIDSDPYIIKAFQSKKVQPEAIVLGTSRAMRLNPPIIERMTGNSAYNLGLAAATPYINFKYLEYAIKVDKNLKTVFLGLDFEVFNSNFQNHANYDEGRLTSPLYMQDLLVTLLSDKALIDSGKVVIDNINHTTRFTEHRYLGDGSFDETFVFPPNTNQATLQVIPTNFQLSSTSMNYIQKIKELCDQYHLNLYIYISPIHAIILDTYWQNGIWNSFEEWKRQLAGITPIWDFSGYHEISMSSLNQSETYNDLSHFSKKIGDLILNRMLDKKTNNLPAYFGIRITPDNIEEHLKKLRSDREQWPERDENMFELLDRY
ncbi:hypothetical protein [Paenibacillus sp. YIM B09110]|uniref:hypothetical protein n=1 Tax=Paenibacillus sp. YIM B09110 TaxID=3126102 RepID=UPI00301BD4C1